MEEYKLIKNLIRKYENEYSSSVQLLNNFQLKTLINDYLLLNASLFIPIIVMIDQ